MIINRRNLLLGAGAVGLTAAVGGGTVAVAAPDAARPMEPVLSWELTGGFVPASWNALRAPRLVAYDDGTIITDATRRLRVRSSTLRSARNHATAVLRDPANARRRPGAPIIADVPSTVFAVRAAGRRFRAQFEGLDETRSDHVYPRPVYGLLDHLTQLRTKTGEAGSPYRPDAVRLIVLAVEPMEPTDPGQPSQPTDPWHPSQRTGIQPWPVGVPVPHLRKDEYLGQLDLRGAAARALMRAVPHPDPGRWPVFLTRAGRRLSVNWRSLLPHE